MHVCLLETSLPQHAHKEKILEEKINDAHKRLSRPIPKGAHYSDLGELFHDMHVSVKIRLLPFVVIASDEYACKTPLCVSYQSVDTGFLDGIGALHPSQPCTSPSFALSTSLGESGVCYSWSQCTVHCTGDETERGREECTALYNTDYHYYVHG